MALLRLPTETRLPLPGEEAQIILIDLHEGTETVAGATKGWEPQMGANINWGVSDSELFYNDVNTDTWEPFCVKLDPLTGKKTRLGGTVYRISPDGGHIISACMKRMRRTQCGYGVIVPDERVPRNYGPRDDDGLYITDTVTGKSKLLVSIRDAFENCKPEILESVYKNLELYGFHCKYNPTGDKIIFTVRGFETPDHEPWDMISDGMYFWVFTTDTDGSGIRLAVGPEQWFKGGHHINWQPGGRTLSMNLAIDGDNKMYLCQVGYDGSGLRKIHETIPGSGHPTVHPDGRHILTDAYEFEPVSYGDGTVPLRFIDIANNTEKAAVRINVGNDAAKHIDALRVDPHPAWAPDNRHVVFNGFAGGTRRVFIADFGAMLGS
jgi:hypothetical protein